MFVRLDFLFAVQDGHGPVAEVVIKRGDGAADNSLALVPRPALPQDGLGRAADEKRLEELLLGLMVEQIAVELAVAGQGVGEKEREHGAGLVDGAKGVRLAVQSFEPFAQDVAQTAPSGRVVAAAAVQNAEKIAQVLQKFYVRRARREIQVPQDLLGQRPDIEVRLMLFHAGLLRRSTRAKNFAICHAVGDRLTAIMAGADTERYSKTIILRSAGRLVQRVESGFDAWSFHSKRHSQVVESARFRVLLARSRPMRKKSTVLLFAAISCGMVCAAGAKDLNVDFEYRPPQWRTAICLPDDPYKTLVDEKGTLLYHYGRERGDFNTSVSVVVDERAKTAEQSLVSPRMPIVRTERETGDLQIVEEVFALKRAGPAMAKPGYSAERKDRGKLERNWAKPAAEITEKLAAVAVSSPKPIHYQIRVPAGESAIVAAAFCEGWHDEPGRRILDVSAEGAEPRQVDPVAEWGKNMAGLLAFKARDVNGDGLIDLTVAAAAKASDKNAILNGFWVFPAGEKLDDDAVLSGESDSRAALVCYAGQSDADARNDVVLVSVTNKGAAAQTVAPKVVVQSGAADRFARQRPRASRYPRNGAMHRKSRFDKKAEKRKRRRSGDDTRATVDQAGRKRLVCRGLLRRRPH